MGYVNGHFPELKSEGKEGINVGRNEEDK